jgi:D-alanyl-D-alanine carboxypeptidase
VARFADFSALIIFLTVFCGLVGCGSQQQVVAAQEKSPSQPELLRVAELFPSSPKTKILAMQSKERPEYLKEYVELLGKRYEIRRPWLGHRVDVSLISDGSNLVRLPKELTLEGSKIYVTRPTAMALAKMAEAARRDGIQLLVDSGYRSYLYQRNLFVKKLQEGKDFYEIAAGTAPPGYSEHQTGTVVDFVPSDWSFHGGREEKWLMENGGRFHFVQTYGKKSDKGFIWEPWHWRYLPEAFDKSH